VPAAEPVAADDSFRIDLPPASQLDPIVLQALPLAMQHKIIQGYENRGSTLPASNRSVQSDTLLANERTVPEGGHEVPIDCALEKEAEEKDEGITVHDEMAFLAAWKQYIFDWKGSSGQDPANEDVLKVAGYLCKLADSNLEMTEVCLKRLRRFLASDPCQLQSWSSAFNVVLDQVQDRIKNCYGGVLKIEPIVFP